MNQRLAEALRPALDAEIASTRPATGGCISDAWRVELTNGRCVFVKSHRQAPPRFFGVEAAGLAWLEAGAATTLRIPRVVAWSDDEPAFLATEWIDADIAGRYAPDEESFGRALADLHRSGAPSFGWDRDGYVGDLAQPNRSITSWIDFLRDLRLEPLARQAIDRGDLPPSATGAFARLFDRLGDLVGPAEPPARLHGDLWAGNRLVDVDGRSWLIDPAPYGGHREIDLAMMRLFGGFGERAFDAYHETFPLADGHRDRVPLYQLYPLLVHVALFGSGYGAPTMTAISRLLGTA